MALKKWNKKSNSKNSIMTLSDIVRGIQFCVNSSIDILERHFSNQLEKYIDSNNKFFTKTVKLNDNYNDTSLNNSLPQRSGIQVFFYPHSYCRCR